MPSFFCLPLACNRQVDSLDRRQNNLTNIPADIERYRGLEELLLSMNHIKELPKHLFRLPRLRMLDLSDNDISFLPPEVAHLSSLVELNLNRNEITDIPETLKECKQLMTLDLSGNPFARLPDSLCDCTSIVSLGLNDVSLTTLPANIGLLANLRYLEVRENLIRSLPVSIVRLSKLQLLDLGQNEIEQLPAEIGQMQSLREFYIDSNDLEEIPESITQCRYLEQFDVSENKIGALPEEFGDLEMLTDLNISQNAIQTLPSSIGRLKRMTILKAFQNSITYLTPAIGNCESLVELHLTDNLIAELPNSIGELRNLHMLYVDKNQLTSMPETIGSCESLSVLSVRDNQLSDLPMSIGKCENMTVLDVAANKLAYLPFTINVLYKLQALWLSEYQSQALLKLQQDRDPRTGIKVLTCYLLPQANVSAPDLDRQNRTFVGGPKVHFPDQEPTVDEEKGPIGQFERHNTPHPKPAKLKKSSIDGHIIHHDESQPTTLALKKTPTTSPTSEGHQSFASPTSPPVPAPAPRSALKTFNQPIQMQNHSLEDASASRSRNRGVSFSFGDATSSAEEGDESASCPRLRRVNTPHYKTLRGSNSMSMQSAATNETAASQSSLVELSSLHRITLRRDASGELGLSIGGGKDNLPCKTNDAGLFITKVVPHSVASRAGLCVGDKLIRANDVNVVDASQDEAVAAMNAARDNVELTVMRTGSPLVSLQAVQENGRGSRESISALQQQPQQQQRQPNGGVVRPPSSSVGSPQAESLNGLYADTGSSSLNDLLDLEEELRFSHDVTRETNSTINNMSHEPDNELEPTHLSPLPAKIQSPVGMTKIPPPVAPKPILRKPPLPPPQDQNVAPMNGDMAPPEKLTFQSKLDKFKAIDTRVVLNTSSASLPPPDKKPLVSLQDMQKLKEEETKKLAMNGGRMFDTDFSPEKGSFDHLLDDSPLPRQPSVVRTKKAENRAIAAGFISTNGDLSEEEKLRIEQQKRSDWRALRLKSMEQQTAEADALMDRVQRKILSSIGEDTPILMSDEKKKSKKELTENDGEILFADE